MNRPESSVSSEEMERRATRIARTTVAASVGFPVGTLLYCWRGDGYLMDLALSGVASLLAMGIGARAIQRAYNSSTYAQPQENEETSSTPLCELVSDPNVFVELD